MSVNRNVTVPVGGKRSARGIAGMGRWARMIQEHILRAARRLRNRGKQLWETASRPIASHGTGRARRVAGLGRLPALPRFGQWPLRSARLPWRREGQLWAVQRPARVSVRMGVKRPLADFRIWRKQPYSWGAGRLPAPRDAARPPRGDRPQRFVSCVRAPRLDCLYAKPLDVRPSHCTTREISCRPCPFLTASVASAATGLRGGHRRSTGA